MASLETVQHIYDAFERGDIATILSHLSEQVEWEYGVISTDVPWLQARRGRAEVPKFFEAMQAFELRRFEPKTFLERGPLVVALIDVELVVKATGRRIVEEDEVHLWHVNEEGKVIKFAHKVDTHQHWVACHREEVLDA